MARLIMPTEPVTLLNGITATVAAPANATGDGVATLPQYQGFGVPRKFSWEVIITGGVLATSVLDLMGSEDGVNWFVIDTYNGVANTHRDVVDKTFTFITARDTTYTVTSGTPAITVKLYI